MVISPEMKALMIKLKNITGRFQLKLFLEIYGIYTPIGSGTLIRYKEKYLLLTCNHCIKDIEPNKYKEIIAPIGLSMEGTYSPTLLCLRQDADSDLAAFEVSCEALRNSNGQKDFITEDVIADLIATPLSKDDLIVLHATPWGNTEIAESKGQVIIDIETQPYFTVFEDYYGEIVRISVEKSGMREDSEAIILETIAGMSGSPAFRYDANTQSIKFFGILSNGDVHIGSAYILPIHMIKNFLDSFIT